MRAHGNVSLQDGSPLTMPDCVESQKDQQFSHSGNGASSMWTWAKRRDKLRDSRVVCSLARESRTYTGSCIAMIHKNCFPRLAHIALISTLTLTFALPASAAWKEKVLYSFQGGANDGSYPYGSVIFDKQGNLYGVLQDFGGDSCAPLGGECGAVYRLSPPAQKGGSWTETLLYEFQGKGANDGESPNSGLIMDKSGNLYGLTAYGGTGNCTLLGLSAGCGTVYKLSPPKQKGGAWTETILYSFPSATQGYVPIGDLVFDSAGNLYGSTLFGGMKGTTCDPDYGGQCGVVFEISPPKTKGGKWTEKELHAFAGGTDGAEPNGGLVLDDKGSVYGTTAFGGGATCQGAGCGTAFELDDPLTKRGGSWTEKILHRFADGDDGAGPSSGLTFDAKGALYGTTGGGGSGFNGTVFRLTKARGGDWVEAILYNFSYENSKKGSGPGGGLMLDKSGDVYGTAGAGGLYNGGVVYRLKPSGQGKTWPLSVLYSFQRTPDGSGPEARLMPGGAGNLYSTTSGGGISGNGTVFKVSP
jgi:uncharacterized repeat protein (TIGR03803 family)